MPTNQWLNEWLKPGLLAMLILGGCDSNSGQKTLQTAATNTSKTSDSGPISASSFIGAKNGQVQIQSVKANSTSARVTLQLESTGLSLNGDELTKSPIEISILNSLGKEISYLRGQAGKIEIPWSSDVNEIYDLVIKNNSSTEIKIASTVDEQVEVVEDTKAADQRDNAIYKDYTLKGFVGFSRQCKQYQDNGNSTLTVTAESGSYFVNPIIFWGKVQNKKVSNLNHANISIVYGDQEVHLSTLDDLDLSVFREFGGSKADHVNYTRQFYQGYLGAAGQMYTNDTFRFGGDCSSAVQFKLGDNPGVQEVYLKITDDTVSPNVSAQVPLRVTVQPPFSMYEKQGQKLSDWTQCTMNKLTATPETYNGDASLCKEFSFSNLPYLVLDYLMPSKQYAQLTKDSDPTRILFYGYSKPKAFYTQMIANAPAILGGENPTVSLPGCLNVGGLNSVPLSLDKTYLPLGEFNVAKDDVINLSRRSGSYTGLTQFYQGNVDLSGEVSLLTCVPYQGSSCYNQKVVKFNLENCHFKADSGIAVGSITDSFLYPEYFEMSGIVAP